MKNQGPTIYLLPNTIVADTLSPQKSYQCSLVTEELKKCIESLDGILCESGKGARALLKLFGIQKQLYILPKELSRPGANSHKSSAQASHLQKVELAKKVLKDLFTSPGQKWGLVSDAGLVAVADPGAAVIYAARTSKDPIDVRSFYGMSSVTLALSLSGLEGKGFSFEGYLPLSKQTGPSVYRRLERESSQSEKVISWMDTPYRHKDAVSKALEGLQNETLFSVCQNIGSEKQWVLTLPVVSWKSRMRKEENLLQEGPAIYLIRGF